MSELKLAAPWTTYYRQIQAIFKEDPEIKVLYDATEPAIKIYVDNVLKADALSQLFPTEKVFGNVTLKITIVPSNKLAGQDGRGLIKDAFSGNGAVSFIYEVTDAMLSNPMIFVVFKKEVVQFFNDDISSVYGLCSTLYETLAKDLFDGIKGVFFCTDTDNTRLGKPLGEWP